MSNTVIGSVMIVGGGIGGIQAALDLANSGYLVYMVEKTASIGGVMSQLDKTFPTNDCSMCIMSPKLVEVGRHMNIKLITLAEIKDVRGEKGNFEVDIFQKARYIDMDKCIACGACTEKCPKKVDDVYNQKLIKRKAIYVPYPQAVPLKYAIDSENCIKLTKGKCGTCEKTCPAKAINYNDKDKNFSINSGSIILSPGFKTYDPSGKLTYSYDNNPDVVTSIEFERLLSASGPNKGHIVRLSDYAEPKKIAWLQCVGSRDINTCDNGHCSSVCCMYAIKQAIIAKEHEPNLECTIFYMDIRTHGKGFENCYNQAKDKYGIKFIRSRVHSVFDQSGNKKGQVINYVDEVTGKCVSDTYDIVVLSVGMEISPDIKLLAQKLGIELTHGSFCKTNSFDPVATTREGIYVCGAFQGPKDIPQSVIEAGAAALCAGSILAEGRNTLTELKEMPVERNISGERPRVGVFICHCGINISSVIDVKDVGDYAKTLPYVEYVADNLYSCSQDTQDNITKVIQEKSLNRIIVAACSPRTHEPLFQETLLNASLNKYMFEMVNIRNHGSWVHKDYPEKATQKAKDLVRMAVEKVVLFEPLEEAKLEIDQNALVIGGGISGMTAAKALADQGYKVNLIEREAILGGNANNLYITAKGEVIKKELDKLINEVKSSKNINVFTGAELIKVEGFVGNFSTTILQGDLEKNVKHGIAIIATGAYEYKPEEYLYGKYPRVFTGIELDKKFISNDPFLKDVKTAVFIQCVGSREPQRPYCSRICCTHTMISALHLKELNPDMNIFVLYRDIRTYGEKEYLYKEAREKGVIFIRFSSDNKPKITVNEYGLEIEVIDHILQKPVKIKADILSLASAIVPYRDEKLAQFFKVPLNDEGFFAEAHVKLAPSDFAVDGVFLCGLSHYPKPIDESVAQSKAAASSATRLLARKTINTIGTVAQVNPVLCSSCGICVSICPYNAPSFKTSGHFADKAEINPVLCKGCGACVASCRSGALTLKGFSESQLMAMISSTCL
ncbi:MAG: CoB--CoM heterodisulfide reductase iron-sulfur subunit A family protein [Desulfobacterales bacterium]|nr:CoB--CoM heterodisulfide reductase iron-sulfur subunit A family protein [Desulfobacterales bacterium]MBF0397921.1 CoB--CoM heterodisulfide reductase iron-sulfur subunit A family protein [Desulfobacterales bacterium]